jgi:hypothetical protein
MKVDIKANVILDNTNDCVEKGHAAHVAEIMEKHLKECFKDIEKYGKNNPDIDLGSFKLNYQD